MTEKHNFIALRLEAGFETQQQLAQAARVDQSTISHIEQRDRPIRAQTAQKVLRALNAARREQKLPDLRIEHIDWYLLE